MNMSRIVIAALALSLVLTSFVHVGMATAMGVSDIAAIEVSTDGLMDHTLESASVRQSHRTCHNGGYAECQPDNMGHAIANPGVVVRLQSGFPALGAVCPTSILSSPSLRPPIHFV